MIQKPSRSIIERVLDNEASPEEVKLVTAWFQTNEGLEWLASRMDYDEKQIHLGEEDDYIDHVIPSEIMYNRIMSHIRLRNRMRWVYRVAALLIPIVLFLGLFFRIDNQIDILGNSIMKEIKVPNGERMQVAFQDGSTVLLNAGSRIRFPEKFTYQNRKVELEGEGFFEVAKNKKRPFIVVLDNLNVQVLGTKFNVKAYSDEQDIKIALHEGEVQLLSGHFRPMAMHPGEEAVFNRMTQACKIIRRRNIEDSSSWRNNRYIFDQTPFEDVLKTLSRVYSVEFLIHDKQVSTYSLTMEMEKKDLNWSLEELEKVLPVSFLRRGMKIDVYLKE